MSTATPTRDQSRETIRGRFIGSLLGGFTGDALGMPLQGLAASAIARSHGLVRDLLDARLGRGTYGDDTEMTAALAESLVIERTLEVDHLAAHLAHRAGVQRGYSPGTWATLQAIKAGGDWREAAKRRLSGGTFGNAAAARVAPLGLLFHRDLERCADAARRSSEPTHLHPLGRGGAVVQALAVALALRWEADDAATLSPGRFLDLIGEHLLDNECLFLDCFEKIGLMLERHPGLTLDAGDAAWLDRAEAVSAVLGCDTRAFQSVPAAVYAFLSQRGSLEETVITAVSFGGDTDTIAAMAGALAGAHLGAAALPERWLAGLEGGPRGREYVAGLADDLFLLWLEGYSDDPLVPTAL